MKDQKHSPLPWRVTSDGDFTHVFYVDATNGDEVALVTSHECDSRYIVKAVNAHEDLVRELSHLVRLLEPLERDGGLNVPGLATLNGARAALQSAEGLTHVR